jgi:hypothetical protein
LKLAGWQPALHLPKLAFIDIEIAIAIAIIKKNEPLLNSIATSITMSMGIFQGLKSRIRVIPHRIFEELRIKCPELACQTLSETQK